MSHREQAEAAERLTASGWPLSYDPEEGTWGIAFDRYDPERGGRFHDLLGIALSTLVYKREQRDPRTGDPYARLGILADPLMIERLLREQPDFERAAARILAEARRYGLPLPS